MKAYAAIPFFNGGNVNLTISQQQYIVPIFISGP